MTCSRDTESHGLVDETLRAVGSKPVLVIDEYFDDDYGRLLLQRGALDYLDRKMLSLVELQRRVEWAILRNGHRSSTTTRPSNHERGEGGLELSEVQQIYENLPPREREVLELLLNRLAPKQIARRLGTSAKTVQNQIDNLRHKCSAASTTDLIILVLRALHPNE